MAVKYGGRGPAHFSRATSAPNVTPPTPTFLLNEDGASKFLLENGTDKILLES